MARVGTGSVSLSVNLQLTDEATTRLSQPNATERATYSLTLANGTASNQFDRVWSAKGTLSASASLDVDIAGGITDAIGQSATMVEIVGIVIKNLTTSTGVVLRVGADGTAPLATLFGDAASDYINVKPGGMFCVFSPLDGDGYTVTATTADVLQLTNSSGSTALDYEILIFGHSA